MVQIINGKAIAKKILEEIKKEIAKLKIKPGLAVILVGHDPASHLYVNLKEKACAEVGIHFEKYLFFATEPQEKIIAKIKELNQRSDIHGILIQLPLPPRFDTNQVIQAINPQKDIDGFHPQNIKNLLKNKPTIIPAIAQAILKLIDSTNIDSKNKKAIILANSETFAQPIKKLLRDKGLAVETILKTALNFDVSFLTADILVIAIGKVRFIKAEIIKKGAIIIDVGTNRVETENGEIKTVGDVDFESVKEKAGFITPVPGGVGPMTIALLLQNTLQTAKDFAQGRL